MLNVITLNFKSFSDYSIHELFESQISLFFRNKQELKITYILAL